MICNGFICSLSYVAAQCCSKLEMKTAPLWYNLPVEMETEKIDHREGKDNKKNKSPFLHWTHPTVPHKTSVIVGQWHGGLKKGICSWWFSEWIAIIYICHQHLPLPLSVFFGMFLGQILSLQWKKCSRTLAAWSDCHSMSKKRWLVRKQALLAKESIKFWRK